MDDAGLAELRTRRDDLVGETDLGGDSFGLTDGPFEHYERTLEVRSDGQNHRVVERFSYRMAMPVWWIAFWWPMRHGLRHRSNPWWAPPDRLDARAARVLSLLALIQVVDGYLGTVITQTITFAADEFDRGDTAQGLTLALVRLGIIVALAVVALADRKGRRNLLMGAAATAVVTTALGAASPGLWFLGGTQMVARGLTMGMGILIGVFAAEELPRGSRAYGVSIPYPRRRLRGRHGRLGPAGGRPLRAGLANRVPGAAADTPGPCGGCPTPTRVEALLGQQAGRRPSQVAQAGQPVGRTPEAAAAGCHRLPAPGVRRPGQPIPERFLKDHRDYSASGIALFTLFTSTPAGIGIFAAGRLADTRGRRGVGATGLVGGTLFIVSSYYLSGGLMWAGHLVGVVLGALTVALGVYGPELFSTTHRARANGIIVALGVLGSATGLILVGAIVDRLDNYGHALAIVGIGPMLAAALVMARFPETARVELETLNPDDSPLAEPPD